MIDQFTKFPEMGVPQNGGFIRETPTKMDDLGVPLFQETSMNKWLMLMNWTIFSGFHELRSYAVLLPIVPQAASFDPGRPCL